MSATVKNLVAFVFVAGLVALAVYVVAHSANPGAGVGGAVGGAGGVAAVMLLNARRGRVR